jgi:hypothetical protein
MVEERSAIAQSSLLLSSSSSDSFPLTRSAAEALGYLGRLTDDTNAGVGRTGVILPGRNGLVWYGLSFTMVSNT